MTSINVAGVFLASFVVVIVMLLACTTCRRKKKRNAQEERNERSENEYHTPADVNIQQQDFKREDNIYTVPEPNIVYTDLDLLALRRAIKRSPSEPPTQYAEIDEEILNAARKKRQERLYENVPLENKQTAIYDNVNEINI